MIVMAQFELKSVTITPKS